MKCSNCGQEIKKGKESYLNCKIICQRCWNRKKPTKVPRGCHGQKWMEEFYQRWIETPSFPVEVKNRNI